MEKKAISPLIATVLIIGFTIVLAAMIMTWGSTLVRKTTEETGTQAKISVTCSTAVKFTVTSAKKDTTTNEIKVNVRNDADQDIAGFLMRVNLNDGTIKTTSPPLDTAITSFGSGSYTISATTSGFDLNNVISIDVIPRITPETGASPVTCPIETGVMGFTIS